MAPQSMANRRCTMGRCTTSTTSPQSKGKLRPSVKQLEEEKSSPSRKGASPGPTGLWSLTSCFKSLCSLASTQQYSWFSCPIRLSITLRESTLLWKTPLEQRRPITLVVSLTQLSLKLKATSICKPSLLKSRIQLSLSFFLRTAWPTSRLGVIVNLSQQQKQRMTPVQIYSNLILINVESLVHGLCTGTMIWARTSSTMEKSWMLLVQCGPQPWRKTLVWEEHLPSIRCTCNLKLMIKKEELFTPTQLSLESLHSWIRSFSKHRPQSSTRYTRCANKRRKQSLTTQALTLLTRKREGSL